MSLRPLLRGRVTGIAIVAGLLGVVAFVHAWGLGTWPPPGEDEGTYTAQAWAVLELQSLAQYTYWYDHPPLGWLVLAVWGLVTDSFDRASGAVAAGREAVLVAHVVSSALLYVLARRIGLARGFAVAAVGLFSLTPLALHYQRMVHLDNLAVAWALAAFALAASPARRLWAFGAAGVTFGCAVLTKETFLLLLPALFLAVWQSSAGRTRSFCVAVFGALFVLTCSVYVLYATLKHELIPGDGHVSLIDAVQFQLFSRESSGSIFDEESDARGIIQSWLDLDPWLLAGALALTPVALFVRSLRPSALAFSVLALMLLRPGYLPGMYVLAALPFAALIVAGLASAVWQLDIGRAVRRVRWAGPRWLAGRFLRLAIVVVVLAPVVAVAPRWARADWRQMTAPAETPFVQTKHWLFENVDRDRTILVEEPFWLDLVLGADDGRRVGGFHRDRVVWFYKLDLDPAIARRFPRGWRDFDYVVTGGAIVARAAPGAESRAAVANSVVVASFANGHQAFEIRRVIRPPASKLANS